jgi:hypothetical protein
MSKGNTTENDFMKVVFLKAANDPTWRTADYLYIALHESDPGEGGTQSTGETDYTNYARVEVAKSAVGWTITDNQAVNAALIQFPQAGAAHGGTVTHVSIGLLSSGAGQILYSGALNDSLAVSNLIQPQFNISALTITED